MNNLKHLIASVALTGCSIAAMAQGIAVNRENPTVAQNFDSMWNGTEAVLTLPEGWKVDRNTTAPRALNSYDAASTQVMYAGGVSLASNAKNGTWNFGASANEADRAVGGLSTTVADGTRCVNLMTCITNSDEAAISKLSVSYDIEKYREGANAAGFAVQMYTSTDGKSWTSAGDDFYTYFAPDGQTLGAEVVPISVTPVNEKTLLTDLATNEKLYLAWNISVASGTAPDKAMGLSIDNVNITATFVDPSVKVYNVYVEDVTGWESVSLYAEGDAFGAFPGMAPTGSKAINGVPYKAFEVSTFPAVVSVNNSVYYSLPKVNLTEARDYYFAATTKGVTEIADPLTYSGYVDPSIPAFVSSGIYLRGEVNSWGADAAWEFSKEGEGNYALYNKTLSGQFKVADSGWSAACNYGTNGGNAYPGVPYELVSGTDGNCTTGPNTYAAKEIRLTITDGAASLLITIDDDATGLTKVYAVGDFNNWNYMDTKGCLSYDTADGLFHGEITMPKGSDGLSHWRVYQKLGMGGAWGLADNAQAASLNGTLTKGATGNAAVAPGTYDVAFDLANGAYTLTRQASTIVDMKLLPSSPLLVTNVTEPIKVLSLNNSLIDYSEQPDIFNDIAAKMGKDAVWTRHTNLGKTLDYHWDEGEGLTDAGTPGAKMMVRSQAWTHIILQEQTNRPMVSTDAFRASVKKWVAYIRENCPNPNAIVILPVNWGYSSDLDNFVSNNAKFLEIYQSVAAEEGIIVCPVSTAYSVAYNELGALEMKDYMFLDDRHPVDRSAYMAALMEYSLIFGVDPLEITALPAIDKKSPSSGKIAITEDEAAKMRHYASVAMNSVKNYINHVDGTVSFRPVMIDDSYLEYDPEAAVTYSVSGGGSIDANGVFTSDGTEGVFTVTATCGDFTREATVTVAAAKNEVVTFPAIELDADHLSVSENFDSMGDAADAELPSAWRVDRNISAPRSLGTYATAATATTYAGGVNLPSNAKNGIWNFGNNAGDDRAVGGITTGVDNGTRAINLYTHLLNTGTKKITDVAVSYDIEKYRKGNNSAGFAVQLYYSYNGVSWISAGNDFYTYLDPDNATEGFAEVPGQTVTASATLPIDLEPGVDVYLAWNISAASGNNCASAMALAIDNVNIEGSFPVVPTAAHYIYVDDQTGWDALGLYAWGDAEFFGAWPGKTYVDIHNVNGVDYKVFLFDTEKDQSLNLIFNNWNNGQQAPDYNINAARDHYLVVKPTEVKEVDTSGVAAVDLSRGNISFTRDHISAAGASSIEVVNMAGMTVKVIKGDDCSVANLPAGIYVVRAAFADKTLTAKMVR